MFHYSGITHAPVCPYFYRVSELLEPRNDDKFQLYGIIIFLRDVPPLRCARIRINCRPHYPSQFHINMNLFFGTLWVFSIRRFFGGKYCFTKLLTLLFGNQYFFIFISLHCLKIRGQAQIAYDFEDNYQVKLTSCLSFFLLSSSSLNFSPVYIISWCRREQDII